MDTDADKYAIESPAATDLSRFTNESKALSAHISSLAAKSRWNSDKYKRWKPRIPRGVYWQCRWVVIRGIVALEALGWKRPDPWPAALRDSPIPPRASTALLWGVGIGKDELRSLCTSFANNGLDTLGVAPVLVTDCTDFAFYSRLGWLVEYLPSLGENYQSDKLQLIASLYANCPVLPMSAHALDRDQLRALLSTSLCGVLKAPVTSE